MRTEAAIARIVIVGVFLLSTVGCATIATGPGPEVKVRVSSTPSGARVVVNGQDRGITPLVLSLSRKDYYHIVLQKTGYDDFVQELRPGPNPWVLGNIVLGGIIGFAVDLGSGAVSWLNPSELTGRMKPAAVTASSGQHGISPRSC